MDLQELEEARDQCLKELSRLPGWALGSLVETERKQGGGRKPFRYLSRSIQGKNRIIYVSEAQVEILRQALQDGREAKRLLEKVADLTVAIIRSRTRRKAGGA